MVAYPQIISTVVTVAVVSPAATNFVRIQVEVAELSMQFLGEVPHDVLNKNFLKFLQ